MTFTRWSCAAAIAAAASAFTLALPVPAMADPGAWTWAGWGTGSTSCSRYWMTINVAARDGRAVGDFYQEGRVVRKFDLAMDSKGAFVGDVPLDRGEKIRLKGSLGADGGTLTLDGYCKFGGKLKPKPA